MKRIIATWQIPHALFYNESGHKSTAYLETMTKMIRELQDWEDPMIAVEQIRQANMPILFDEQDVCKYKDVYPFVVFPETALGFMIMPEVVTPSCHRFGG